MNDNDNETVHYTELERVWAQLQDPAFERARMMLAIMPAEDRDIVLNKPDSRDRAADSLYRRRCAKWKIDTSARGISKGGDYQKVQTLKRRVELLEERNQTCSYELSNTSTLLAHARVMLQRADEPGSNVLAELRETLNAAKDDVIRYQAAVHWSLHNMCEDCLAAINDGMNDVIGARKLCDSCAANIKSLLSYVAAERARLRAGD